MNVLSNKEILTWSRGPLSIELEQNNDRTIANSDFGMIRVVHPK
jgi:hypothetical protein